MTRGCIYIARNDEINPPNLYKIGMTEFATPENRMRTLTEDTTNWAGKYEAKAWFFVDDVRECENKIHMKFRDKRANDGREFFWGEITEFVNAIKFYLGDKIIPGFGIEDGFDINIVSNKTIHSIKEKKLKSIFDLFKFANQGLISCRSIWENNSAFIRGLILIISNNLNKDINLRDIDHDPIQKLFKSEYFLILCKELSKLNTDNLYLYINSQINEPIRQHNEILSRKAIRKEAIKIIRDTILNIMRNTDESRMLNKIVKSKLKGTPYYEHCYYKQRYKELYEIRYAEQIAADKEIRIKEQNEIREEEKIKLNQIKNEQNKINIKYQKQEQKIRKKAYVEYINNLEKLNLADRLKFIVNDHKYGLGGIPKELLITDNFNNFQENFLSLSFNEQKKFKEILNRNRQDFFKKLLKKLKDIEQIMRLEWRTFINSNSDIKKFKNLNKDFYLNDEDIEIADVPNSNSEIDKILIFSETNKSKFNFEEYHQVYNEYFFKNKHVNSIKVLRSLMNYLFEKSELEKNHIENKITNFLNFKDKKEIKYEKEIRVILTDIIKTLKNQKTV